MCMDLSIMLGKTWPAIEVGNLVGHRVFHKEKACGMLHFIECKDLLLHLQKSACCDEFHNRRTVFFQV